jgi:tetratricopeptide (TPR) repeat protein
LIVRPDLLMSRPTQFDTAGQRYAAFISYNHQDRGAAQWLHRALEGYHPPRGVVVGDFPLAALRPIFLDRAELPSSSDLAASVREALTASRCLIVVCSPAAAKSRWVNEEVRYFKSLGRAGRIFALFVAGDAHHPGSADDCLPPALRYRVDEHGQVTSTAVPEPLAADLRPNGDERRTAMLKIAAGMLEVPLDRLVQRDTARRQRRLMRLAAAALVGCLAFALLSVAAVQSRNEAERQRRIAVQQSLTAQRTVGFLKSLFAVSDPSEARGRSITAREVLDRGVKQIDSQLNNEPLVRAELMTTLGEVYGSLGLLREGGDLLERAQSITPLPDALAARQTGALGDLLRQQGELEAARTTLERAQAVLAHDPQLQGGDVYIRVNNSLGIVYRDQDKCDQARKAYRAALNASTRATPPDLEGWRVAIEGIAQCDMDEGDFANAEAGFTTALARQLAMTGEAHPHTAEILSELGSVKYFQGDRAGAAAYYRRTLAIDRQILGEGHPDMEWTANNLARVLLEQRKFAEARALLEASLQSFAQHVVDTDPKLTFVLANLALIEMQTQHYPAARAYFDRALQNAILNKHRLHGPILTDLADLDCRTGEVDAGLARLEAARPIVAARYPEDAWRLAHLDNVRAGCLTRARRYSEAEPLIASSMPVLLQKWPVDTLYGFDGLERSMALFRLTGNQAQLQHYRVLAENRTVKAQLK